MFLRSFLQKYLPYQIEDQHMQSKDSTEHLRIHTQVLQCGGWSGGTIKKIIKIRELFLDDMSEDGRQKRIKNSLFLIVA